MMQRQDPFEKFIDWNVHNEMQGGSSMPSQNIESPSYQEPEDYDIANPKHQETVKTFLGEMPRINHRDQLNDPEYQKQMVHAMELGLGGGINMIENIGSQALRGPAIEAFEKGKEFVKPGINKIKEFMKPNMESESKLSALNPMRYTSKNIAENIVQKGKNIQEQYGKEYQNLWQSAEKKGVGLSPDIAIDFKTISKYTPDKKIEGLTDFIANPSLESAHFAKSDLKALQRSFKKYDTLNKAQRTQKKAIDDAVAKIDAGMFSSGEQDLAEALKNQYQELQSGFRKEVLPYRNKNIQKYKEQELSASQLVKKLKEGPFSVKRGAHHPELKRHELIKKLLLGGGIGLPIYGYLSKE
jgi:hypothetical protein